MPCRSDGYPDVCPSDRLKAINQLTRMLCEVMVVRKDGDFAISDELTEWWDAHQEADRLRQVQEEAQARVRETKRVARIIQLERELEALKKK